MAGESAGGSPIAALNIAGHDINVDESTMASLDTEGHENVSYQGVVATGTFGTAVITPEGSNNNVDFVALAGDTLTAAGIVENIAFSMRYFRLRVTTAEGGVGTADFFIVAK